MADQIVFFKDYEKEIIDRERTDQHLKKMNELFNYLLSDEQFIYDDLVREVIEEIGEIYKQGYNLGVEAVINHYEINAEEVEKIPKSAKSINGIKPKMFNKEDVEKMKKLKKLEYSNYKIARKYKCSEKTIRNYLKE